MVYRFVVVAFVALLQVFSSASFLQAQTRCDSSLVVSGWVFELGGGIIPAAMARNMSDSPLLRGTVVFFFVPARETRLCLVQSDSILWRKRWSLR